MLDRRRFRFLLFFVLVSLFPAPARAQIVDRAKNGSLNVAWNGVGVEPAGSTVRISLAGQGAAAAQVTGTFVATLSFEALIDEKAATWLAIKGTPFTGGTNVSSTTGVGAWVFPLSGVRTLRIRCSAYTSGTANIGMISTPAVSTVTIAGGTGGSATSVSDADSSPFAIGTDPFNPIGGTFNDAAAALTAGQQGIQRLTPNRAGHVNLRNNAGTEIATAANPARVDPTGTTPQPVTGTFFQATQPVSGTKTNNNAAPGATNIGAFPAVANAAAQSWTEGNQVALSTDLAGSLRALIASPLPTGTNSIGAVTQGAAPWNIQGQQANGAAVTEQPVLIAGQNAGNVRLFALDAAGQATVNQGGTGSGGTAAWFAQGPDAAGTAVAGRPFGEGISDGTNIQIAKQITSATGTTGVGLQGVGTALWDLVGTTNYVKQAGDGSGRAMVVGAAATGTALAGNPVRVAGSDGTNAVDLQVDGSTGKNLMVGIRGTNATVQAGVTNAADSFSNSFGLAVNSQNHAWDGANWNRIRDNINAILQASTATTVQTINTDITTYNNHTFMFHANVSNYNGGSLLAKLQWKDANGLFADIPGATTGALTTGADVMLIVGKNAWPANAAPVFYANFPVPRTIRLVETIATATVTFSSAYDLVDQ